MLLSLVVAPVVLVTVVVVVLGGIAVVFLVRTQAVVIPLKVRWSYPLGNTLSQSALVVRQLERLPVVDFKEIVAFFHQWLVLAVVLAVVMVFRVWREVRVVVPLLTVLQVVLAYLGKATMVEIPPQALFSLVEVGVGLVLLVGQMLATLPGLEETVFHLL
jgi:hypothetical protein